MFQNEEQLLEFVDNADGVLMEQLFEQTISDACLYEDQFIVEALDRYVEMLENDDVDEKFEEHLSTVLAPYFSSTAMFYENVIVMDEAGKFKMAMKGMGKGIAAGAKGTARGIGAAGKGVGKGAAWTAKKAWAGTKATGKGIGKTGAWTGKKIAAGAKAAYAGAKKGATWLNRMRKRFGPGALAAKIKSGYGKAKAWASDTALVKGLKTAHAVAATKSARKARQKGYKKTQKAKKLAKNLPANA